MNLVNKLVCLLFYCLLVTEIFSQEYSYILRNENIKNSSITWSAYDLSKFTPIKKYNTSGILDSLIYERTNGERTKSVYNFNEDLSLSYFTSSVWYNNEWVNSEKHTNTYNTNGNLESVLWELFNSSSEEWFKIAKDVYNYDSLGNRVYQLHQSFNGRDFVNKFKYENYFKGTNLVSSVNQHWVDGAWVNSSKVINIINSDNLKDTTLFQDWKNNKWVNYQMNEFEYDEKHNIIYNVAKRWQEDKWVNFGKGLYEYDSNNNCVLENWEIAINNNWENWFRIFYEYDNDDNLIHLFGEEWENGNWVPENELLLVTNPDGILYGYLARELFLFYSNSTTVRSDKNITYKINLFQNYPNPFNPATTIEYQIPTAGYVNLTVYNILGKKIKTLVDKFTDAGKHNVTFNAPNLPSGIYIYKITAGKFSEVRKMQLIK